MHMVFIFYGLTTCGSLILSILYMNKFWTNEKFEEINRIEGEAHNHHKEG